MPPLASALLFMENDVQIDRNVSAMGNGSELGPALHTAESPLYTAQNPADCQCRKMFLYKQDSPTSIRCNESSEQSNIQRHVEQSTSLPVPKIILKSKSITMINSIIKAVHKMERLLLTGKRADKIVSAAAAAGTRAAPARNTPEEKEIGIRFDYGEVKDRDGRQVRHFKVQPNKGAADPTLKSLAAKNLHQVLAEAFVPIDSKDSKEAVKELCADLIDDAKRKDAEREAKKQPKKGGKK